MSIQDDGDRRDIFDALADDFDTAKARREHTAGSGRADGMAFEALPTVYKGTTFRSALEASWAATLDSLHITWEYEPELIELPSGAHYLPDFRLPEIGTWLEVKGADVPRIEKAYELGDTLRCDCPRIRGIRRCSCPWPGGWLVVIGNPPRPMDPWADESYDHWPHHSKRRLAWRHGGFPSWTSTRNNRLWLTRCTRCRLVTWFDSGKCRACRGPLAGSVGHHSGSDEFEFIRISGAAIGAGEDDGEAA